MSVHQVSPTVSRLVRPAPAGPPKPTRSLAGYLVMPRPKDIVKGLLIPAIAVVGLLGPGEVDMTVLMRALVVLVAVELLIYPARYQWNDIRGFVADQQHPSSADRGRLPGPLSRCRLHVSASVAVIALRLLAVLVLAVAFPSLHLAGVLAFATVGVFGVAGVYETLRSSSTGRTGLVPPPLRIGVVALWITVGAGYVVRGVTGLALALPLSEHRPLVIAAVITLWAYGIAFVTSRWAVEATAFASVDHAGVVTWQARAGQAREHLLTLVRWLPHRLSADDVGVADTRRWAPLARRTPLTSPWNLAMVVAGGGAGAAGALLVEPGTPGYLPVATVIGAMATIAVLLTSRFRMVAIAGAVVVQYSAAEWVGSSDALVAVVPWAAVAAAHQYFSTRSVAVLSRPNRVARPLTVATERLGRLVLGDATWSAVRTPRHDGAHV